MCLRKPNRCRLSKALSCLSYDGKHSREHIRVSGHGSRYGWNWGQWWGILWLINGYFGGIPVCGQGSIVYHHCRHMCCGWTFKLWSLWTFIGRCQSWWVGTVCVGCIHIGSLDGIHSVRGEVWLGKWGTPDIPSSGEATLSWQVASSTLRYGCGIWHCDGGSITNVGYRGVSEDPWGWCRSMRVLVSHLGVPIWLEKRWGVHSLREVMAPEWWDISGNLI